MNYLTTHHRWMHISVIGALLLTMFATTTAFAADPSVCGATYTVQTGDTLSGIAVFCGVSLTTLEQANPQITDYNLIYPGQQVTIPQGIIPVTGAQAQVAISPVSGGPGASLTVTGSNYPASETLNVTAAQQNSSAKTSISTTTDIYGSFTTTLFIPSDAAAGSLWIITATTLTRGGPTASVNFQVVESAPATGYYTVQSGDTLSGIALRFGTTVTALLRANPSLNNSSVITVGEQLAIPGSLVTSNGQSIYIVKSGDYLQAIATAQGVTLSALEQANSNITDFSLIYPGERIIIPSSVIPVTGSQAQISLTPVSGPIRSQVTVAGTNFPANAAINVSAGPQGQSPVFTTALTSDSNGNFSVVEVIPSDAAQGSIWVFTAATQASGGPSVTMNFQVTAQAPAGFYTVQSGDTLSALALRFNTTVNALLLANPQITNANALTAGSQLYIPGSQVTVNGQTIYVVKSGDSLSLIANNQGISLASLEQANPGITTPSLIYPGEHVVIP